jgi:tRNA(Ile)-lysidine synthase
MRLELQRLDLPSSFELIEKLRGSSGEPVMVSPERRIYRERSGELREVARVELEHSSNEKRLSMAHAGHNDLANVFVAWEFVEERGPAQPLTEYFDADEIGASVVLRHWRPGDRFQPAGAAVARKLQDLFTNMKVPPEERRSRLLAQAENGELFWVEGLRIGEKFKVNSSTRRVLKWSWRREPLSAR